jgi:type II secretory pathway pseudopilin PulG
MEPERKIEKRLRAYAQKRRAAAGDSLKLHPVNRRLLQDAAARRTPEPGEGGAGNLFLLFRTALRHKLVFALCVVAIAFVGASLFLPALSASKDKAQRISAVNNLRQIGMATRRYAEDNKDVLPASLDELTNELPADLMNVVLTDPQTGRRYVYVAGGKDLQTLPSNAVLAYSPENENGHAVLFADGRVEVVTKRSFAGLTNQKAPEFVLADKVTFESRAKTALNVPLAAASPPPAAEAASDLEKSKLVAGASQSFAQTGTASKQQNLYRNVSVAAQTAPVLQSFQVLQNGDAISVVDRDGSVYQGLVQVAAAVERQEAVPVEAPPGGTVASEPGQLGAMPSAGNQQPAAQNYFFRVAGMNRTLKQNVVFSGNVEAIAGASTNGHQTFGSGIGGGGGGGAGNQLPQAAANASQQNVLSNSRIVGTAVIDDTKRIEIDAVPVAP